MFGCCQSNSEYDLEGELGTFIFRYLPNGDINERCFCNSTPEVRLTSMVQRDTDK